ATRSAGMPRSWAKARRAVATAGSKSGAVSKPPLHRRTASDTASAAPVRGAADARGVEVTLRDLEGVAERVTHAFILQPGRDRDRAARASPVVRWHYAQ